MGDGNEINYHYHLWTDWKTKGRSEKIADCVSHLMTWFRTGSRTKAFMRNGTTAHGHLAGESEHQRPQQVQQAAIVKTNCFSDPIWSCEERQHAAGNNRQDVTKHYFNFRVCSRLLGRAVDVSLFCPCAARLWCCSACTWDWAPFQPGP